MIERSFTALKHGFVFYRFEAGEGLPRHSHTIDHLMIVNAGRVRVQTDAADIEVGPDDNPVLFRAPKFHAITALVDGTKVLNVFPPEEVSP